jgi:hypothetical protein
MRKEGKIVEMVDSGWSTNNPGKDRVRWKTTITVSA